MYLSAMKTRFFLKGNTVSPARHLGGMSAYSVLDRLYRVKILVANNPIRFLTSTWCGAGVLIGQIHRKIAVLNGDRVQSNAVRKRSSLRSELSKALLSWRDRSGGLLNLEVSRTLQRSTINQKQHTQLSPVKMIQPAQSNGVHMENDISHQKDLRRIIPQIGRINNKQPLGVSRFQGFIASQRSNDCSWGQQRYLHGERPTDYGADLRGEARSYLENSAPYSVPRKFRLSK